MSQDIPGTINPNTTSGTQLAALIDGFVEATVTGFSGTIRPPNLLPGGYWIDTTDDATDIWVYRLYDGTNDIPVFTINKASGGIILDGTEDEFLIKKTSDDSLGPKFILEKKRIAGSGQTLIGDELGVIEFKGNSTTTNYIQARIKSLSTDDVTGAEQGAYLTFETTAVDGNTLNEAMRLTGDNKLGVGISAPEATVHSKAIDSTAGIKATRVQDAVGGPRQILNKKRATGNGQVLNLDEIGTSLWTATDQNGAEVEVAKIEVLATENISDIAHGSKMVISTKVAGSTVYQEAIKIESGKVTILGQEETNLQQSVAFLDDAATRNLATINGAVYGAFQLTATFVGRDLVDTRKQIAKINGAYSANLDVWTYEEENNLLLNAQAATFDYTNGTSLVIDYVNKFVAANYNADGKIYIEIKRYLV